MKLSKQYRNLISTGVLICKVEKGLKNFTKRHLPSWLHFDVIDLKFMLVMFPEPGGLTFEELVEFLILVRTSGRNIGLSIARYHPKLDIDGYASARLVTLITNVLSMYSNLESSNENL